MTSRLDMLRGMLSAEQLADLSRVQNALDRDPTCLDRKENHEECVQGVSDLQDSRAESA